MPNIDMATLRQIGRAYLLSIGLWCGLSLLVGWQDHIYHESLNIHSRLLEAMLLAESRGIAYAALTPPIFFIVHRYIGGTRNAVRYLSAYAVGAGVFMMLCASIRWAVLLRWDVTLEQYLPRSEHGVFDLVRGGFADQITIYIALVVAAHGYEYFATVQKQQREGPELERAVAAGDEPPLPSVEILRQVQKIARRPTTKIGIKEKGRILLMDPTEIVAIQAEGNCVLLQREAGSFLLRESLSGIAEKLQAYGFIRIHRSVLINSAFVEEVWPCLTGEYGLRLKGGKQYTVTRTFKKNLRSLAEFWIGTDTFLAA